ncbi:MAG: hypothetical protein Kow00114_32880 [Kiloniellaceae bacterium]
MKLRYLFRGLLVALACLAAVPTAKAFPLLGETTQALLSQLPVAPGAAYETAYCLEIPGPIEAGEIFLVYGEAHGNPLQNNQVELSWVTGIYAGEGCAHKPPYLYTAARARGRDLEKNRKHDDTRIGAFVTTQAHPDGLVLRYVMRAVNLNPGGYLALSTDYGKLGYLRF